MIWCINMIWVRYDWNEKDRWLFSKIIEKKKIIVDKYKNINII